MDPFFREQAIIFHRSHVRQRWRRRLFRILAGVVVFCTTYALILPAITMEKQPVCGLEEHEHTFQCYLTGYPFRCPQMESDTPVVHQHEGLCFAEDGTLICTLPEVREHLHEDSCYSITPIPPCTLEETEGHTHSDLCREHSEEPLCSLPEGEGHSHDDSCYVLTETYICAMEEIPAHLHEAACYSAEPSLCCGMEEAAPHTHTDACSITENKLTCTLPESEGHIHTDACMQTVQNLTCTITDDETHIHGDGCYSTERIPICTLTPDEGHRHSEGCYSPTTTLVCTLPETQGHAHSEDCYRPTLLCTLEQTEGHSHTDLCKERILNCGLQEAAPHTHTEDCFTKLICTQEEIPPHHHDESCLGGEIRELLCTLPEIKLHTHTEICTEDCPLPQTEAHIHTGECLMTEEEALAVLTCPIKAHLHDETCFQAAAEEGYLCGFGSHTHGEHCMDENGQQVCSIPEHQHTIACVLETYDPTADMETAADWEATFSHIPKTGIWQDDVLAIARSQLGYTESERNCFLYDDGTIRGYTRYGAWYGSPYGDWCATFVSFCLNYGDVENFPLDSGCSSWAQQLQGIGAYHCQDGYLPKPGDLAFFDWEYTPGSEISPDHVGLVAQVTADGSIVTIEGDSDNRVRYCTYSPDDPRLVSYGELPEGKPQPDVFTQTYTGPDYTVTVSYDASANLPEDALLTVREIPPDSEEYALYYSQAVQALQANEPAPVSEEPPTVSDEPPPEPEYTFARFFDIHFILNDTVIEPEAPVEVSITYLDQVELPEEDSGKVVHFADKGIEILQPETNAAQNQADTFSFTQNSFSVSGILVKALPGMSAALTHEVNDQTDAFLYNPAYSQYYNANSPIGTAGSFHIVAFDTANLYTHTNGNVLAKNLYANSNFGTNGYADELTYIQNYVQVNGGSASRNEHVLVLGSSNNVTLTDNGNAFSVNDRKLDRPRNVVQDADTALAPFIDLNRVKAEIRQIGANLAGYEDCNLNISYLEQYNHITLANPDTVGILNVTPNDPAVFGKHRVLFYGFRSGHSGSMVITVNCAGYDTVTLPHEALVVVDGQIQGTNEVVEFSNGKVLWNFINASGVTINANRMTGMIIAPGATVNINQNLNGTVVADTVNVRAESHRTDFTGKIVPPPDDDDDGTERFVTLQKIKAGYAGTTLAGAVFDLYREENGVWAKVDTGPIVTDGKGLFLLKGVLADKAYRLVETQAPPGYQLATEPFDFWIPSNPNLTMPPNAPGNFRGTAIDSGDVLNLPNRPDKTVETTLLNLKKEWAPTSLPIPSRISVDIYQIAVTGGQTGEPVLFKTVVLSQTLNWELEVTDLPKSITAEDGTVTTFFYSVQERPVPGFKPSYSENNARGVSGETILITNTEAGVGYVIPETGGMGTLPYSICGLLVLLYAFVYGARSLPKRKEGKSH